ncbi:leucine ABC transporter subunit substrate-binding protein LivK [Variovorax sp. PBS-H4]|uniref:ABC transporter substrate-binding protein n=1 Tax=Variovorax sp. PBS-H4 TaxID=434008 RepID=UPI00131763BF|nr:ABC transporter substrate-binding protein [Variovorax sp. PBS-H4]VTU23325.1 leucine ABC transporter subunit substrate-binding protein LivK [Variovorax sp. PBS-H4]
MNVPRNALSRRTLLKASMAPFAMSLGTASSQAAADFRGEIKLGQTMPYSGPLSALSAIGKVQTRYFKMVNDGGGINGRSVNLLTVDDAYNPAKAVEQTRNLVEREGVKAMFASMGTAQNVAVQKYLNGRKVPQLFVYAGSDRFADPQNYPWTLPGLPTFSTEASVYADYVHKVNPGAKVAVLYQNDDFGKEYLASFKRRLQELGGKAQVVAAAGYEATAPTVESQLITLSGSGADVFMNITSPKFTIQAIRKVSELPWKPLHIIPITSNFVATVLRVAGLDKSVGLISATPSKSAGDPEWAGDAGFQEWLGFMKKYYPEGDTTEQLNLVGYSMGCLMTEVLRRCGDELSSERILKEATSLNNVALPALIPGITANTSPKDYRLIQQLRLQRFDGSRWVPVTA